MSRTHTITTKYQAPLENVLTAVSSARFEEARLVGQGMVSAKVRERERTDSRLVYDIECVEYGRTMTGAEDRKKTVNSSFSYRWDLGKRKAEWTYTSPHSKMVSLRGSLEVRSGAQDATEVVSQFEVHVSLPLIGGKIEKMILEEIDKGAKVAERELNKLLK